MRHQQHWLIAFGLVLVSAGQAQWLNFPTPGIPRTKDGKPNLTAKAPRTADGKPDLSGVWMHEPTTVKEVQRIFGTQLDDDIKTSGAGMEIGTQHKYGFNILIDFQPEDSPMRAETAAIMKRNAEAEDDGDPCSYFYGWPLAGLLSEPLKIIQSPRVTAVLYELDGLHRQIYTDGRRLPKEFDLPGYLGYSVGRWEKDVLVVESAGFNDKAPLDVMGHPRSEAMKVTERFHRVDFGHLDVEMTFDDPTLYKRPFTVKVPHVLMADADIFEMFCRENEKDGKHLKKQ